MSTYNGEKFIDEQLKSIADQTYENLVLIIRDDGSTDKTLEIIEAWKGRIQLKVISSNENLGPALSFMELARTCGNFDFYAFADQDDIWDKDKIWKAVNSIEGCSGSALYFCNSRNIDTDGNRMDSTRKECRNDFTVESELVCGYCPGCAMVFNSMLMEEVRRHAYRIVPMHDMVFIMTALAIGEVIYDDVEYFSRRMHAGNVVGREGKSKAQRLGQSLRRWFVESKKCPIDKFVEDFVTNTENKQPKYDMEQMRALANYKKHFGNKMKIYKSKRFVSSNAAGHRSFQIRLLLNLL